MYILGVSPGYLRYLKLESENYEFRFQGYSSLKEASNGLIFVNPSEYIGFTVVMSSLPEDKRELKDFLLKCNTISEKSKVRKRFVFALEDSSGLTAFLKSLKLNGLDFYRAEYEIMTDLFIKQEIFGTILESVYGPYEKKHSSRTKGSLPSLKSLKFVPLFPPSFIKAVSEIKVRDVLHDTMVEDPYLEELKSSNELLYTLRLYAIRLRFNEEESVLEREVEAMISKVEDKSLRLQYEMLLKYVKESWGKANVINSY